MDSRGTAILAAAHRLVGVRFRPQGCDPETGLDCVGLVWAAHAAAGCPIARPADYPRRGWSRPRIEAAMAAAGLGPAADAPRDGDAALFALAAGQFHLAIWGRWALVHAHAGLRRVVAAPHAALPPATGYWRIMCAGKEE